MTKIRLAGAAVLLIALVIVAANLFAKQADHTHAANGVPVLHIVVNEPNIQAVQLSFHDINGKSVNPCVLLTSSNRPNREINYAFQAGASQWVNVSVFTSPINQASPCAGPVNEPLSRIEQVSGTGDATITV